MNNYYEEHSKEYIKKTQNANMKSEYEHFLKYIPKGGTILDLGCGSSRDALAFKDMGYEVYCLDPVKEFCDYAIEKGINSQNVLNISILDLKETKKFDGIWACASLLHLNTLELIQAFNIIQIALKPNGYFYSSFKYGEFEGIRDNRYYLDLTKERFESNLNFTKMVLVEDWIQEDKLSRGNEWINFIVKLNYLKKRKKTKISRRTNFYGSYD